MVSQPISGQSWGHEEMPLQFEVFFFMPNGLFISMNINKDSTLHKVKSDLWVELEKYPFSHILYDMSCYIFVGVTQDGEREEFYDEKRRLCDLRLFKPFLKLVEPAGNKDEKIFNAKIQFMVGISYNELNLCRSDQELLAFKQSIMKFCREIVEKRMSKTLEEQALYYHPPNVSTISFFPTRLHDLFAKDEGFLNMSVRLSSQADSPRFTIRIKFDSLVQNLIEETIKKKFRLENIASDQIEKNSSASSFDYFVKVAGLNEFLLGNYSLCNYKYVRKRLLLGKIPEFILIEKDEVYHEIMKIQSNNPMHLLKDNSITTCSSLSSSSMKNNSVEKPNFFLSTWLVQEPFMIKIVAANFIRDKEKGEYFVKVGLFEGFDSLCAQKQTEKIESAQPIWNQWVTFDLKVMDIPRSGKLCVAVCFSVGKKSKKKMEVCIGWCNVNLFDFKRHLLQGTLTLGLWPSLLSNQILNPFGPNGTNTHIDAATLEIEVFKYEDENNNKLTSHNNKKYFISNINKKMNHNNMKSNQNYIINAIDKSNSNNSDIILYFPDDEEVIKHGQMLVENLEKLEGFKTNMIDLKNIRKLKKKGLLMELSEQDKAFLWGKINYCCKDSTNFLPKIIQSVHFADRDKISILRYYIEQWRDLSLESALELLQPCYQETRIREYAVGRLKDKHDYIYLSNSHYLLQLVNLLVFEPYYDNALVRFLLEMALTNQKIGQTFFWYLKATSQQNNTKSLYFHLILEAYLKSCGNFQALYEQVEAVDKLMKLSEILKMEKKELRVKSLHTRLMDPHDLEPIEHFISPLDTTVNLDQIIVEKCTIMNSKKRPLFLTWQNSDLSADLTSQYFQLIFKTGDDLRQDMLTLQVFQLMEDIWQRNGLDVQLLPYACLATSTNSGIIEVVRDAKTVTQIIASRFHATELHNWIKENNPPSEQDNCPYTQAVKNFTRTCAGYCVATFILGIGDRHPSNIMVTKEGQVFHIDFGHFLDHRKKKLGISRERVPFVLTQDFIKVIAKGSDNPEKSEEFSNFMELCGKAYLKLREEGNLLITLFTMMLSSGIPELQSVDDVNYIKKTLKCDASSDEEALKYFQTQFSEAYGGAWTTKVDWFFHWVKQKT